MMNIQTFRYATAGMGNTLLGFLVYFVSFRYILQEKDLHFSFYAFKAHVAALFMSFLVSFPALKLASAWFPR